MYQNNTSDWLTVKFSIILLQCHVSNNKDLAHKLKIRLFQENILAVSSIMASRYICVIHSLNNRVILLHVTEHNIEACYRGIIL